VASESSRAPAVSATREIAGMAIPRIVLGGVPVDLLDEAGIETLLQATLAGSAAPLLLASANLDKVHYFGAARPDEGFFTRSRHADRWLVLLDGAPLVRQARRLTHRDWPRLAGADLLPALLTRCERDVARVGFLGGWPSTHARLRSAITKRWPALEVAGMWAPTAADVVADTPALAESVRRARTDVLLVALTPNGERWLDRWSDATGIRVGAAWGAAAEFLVAERRRAPTMVQRLGVEWAWRLASEPRRLARRYLIDGPPSYWLVRRASYDPAVRTTVPTGRTRRRVPPGR
jgi:N-acetylglucosaminyldiphosphoundecaprenol N-acetyl-beta-D-mannosaminyltransferase